MTDPVFKDAETAAQSFYRLLTECSEYLWLRHNDQVKEENHTIARFNRDLVNKIDRTKRAHILDAHKWF